MICNAGRIEAGDKSYCLFGRDSLTKSVVGLVDKLDLERRAIGDKLGIPNNSLSEEILLVGWNPRFGMYARSRPGEVLPLNEAIHNEYLEICEGPYALDVRMFTEDIPHGLLTFASLGDMLDVPTPLSKAISTIASALLERDFTKEARTVKDLGLDPSWSVKQVNNYLEEGTITP
jgi:opine dehydrogenase